MLHTPETFYNAAINNAPTNDVDFAKWLCLVTGFRSGLSLCTVARNLALLGLSIHFRLTVRWIKFEAKKLSIKDLTGVSIRT